jgi:hypothetical protein
MSKAVWIGGGLIALLVAGFVGLAVLASGTEPPSQQVEKVLPDEQFPK